MPESLKTEDNYKPETAGTFRAEYYDPEGNLLWFSEFKNTIVTISVDGSIDNHAIYETKPIQPGTQPMNYEEILKLDSITFDVTYEDIYKAVARPCSICPVTEAIARTLGLETDLVYVPGSSCEENQVIRIHRIVDGKFSRDHAKFANSPEIMDFVEKLNYMKIVYPTTFTIERIKV